MSSLSFIVSVEGESFSAHRDPKGLYKVNVLAEKTLLHSACAALEVARESVPFLQENSEAFTLRAYRDDGREVRIPKALNTVHAQHGKLCGRERQLPQAQTVH